MLKHTHTHTHTLRIAQPVVFVLSYDQPQLILFLLFFSTHIHNYIINFEIHVTQVTESS